MYTRLVDRNYAVLLASALAILATSDFARAQGYPGKFEFGAPASAQDIASVAIAVAPDGKNLPVGKGDYAAGKVVYEAKCSACHGANLQGVAGLPDMPAGGGFRGTGGPAPLFPQEPLVVVENYFPLFTALVYLLSRS